MDLKTQMTKEQQQTSAEPEQQQKEQSMSKSSVHSSTTTGTTNENSDEQTSMVTLSEGEEEETDATLQDQKWEEIAEEHSSTNDTVDEASPPPAPPPAAVTAAKAYYEDLVKECKVRMGNTFDTLEAETGIRLTEDGGLCMVLAQEEVDVLPRKSTNPFANHHSTPANSCATAPPPPLPNNDSQSALRGLDHVRMEKELRRLKEELALKNDIVEKMCRIRTQVEAELEDLTASLFEEANKMVYTANVLRDRTEKDLVEATLKIDMLTAEVDALKLLVITSTPSRPNAHLHPQIGNTSSSPSRHGRKGATDGQPHLNANGSSKATKSAVRKSPSNYELGKGSSSKQELSEGSKDRGGNSQETDDLLQILEESSQFGELDPLYYSEFVEWRKAPTLEPMKSDFMKRIYDEEIYPVFNFKNKDLTAAVLRCIESNCLTVESVTGAASGAEGGAAFPKRCALLEVPRACSHRMKLQTDDQRWYAISALCRNRIAAVCDLFCYLGYIKSGLVKSDTRQMYWQIMRRRHSIVTSKLGFQSSALLQ